MFFFDKTIVKMVKTEKKKKTFSFSFFSWEETNSGAVSLVAVYLNGRGRLNPAAEQGKKNNKNQTQSQNCDFEGSTFSSFLKKDYTNHGFVAWWGSDVWEDIQVFLF